MLFYLCLDQRPLFHLFPPCAEYLHPAVILLTWRSLMFGKGIPMVTTALALSSVKSSPSLTLPLQTAISSAPSITKKPQYIKHYK